MGSSFLKIMTVARVTFHGLEAFAAFFQWCISIHKTSVLSALTTTCFPDYWCSKATLAIVVSASATHWKPFWDKRLLNPAIKRSLLFWLSENSSWDFFIWYEGNVGQICTTCIFMLHIFCRGTISKTIKHDIAVSVCDLEMFFV